MENKTSSIERDDLLLVIYVLEIDVLPFCNNHNNYNNAS